MPSFKTSSRIYQYDEYRIYLIRRFEMRHFGIRLDDFQIDQFAICVVLDGALEKLDASVAALFRETLQKQGALLIIKVLKPPTSTMSIIIIL